MPNLEPFLGEVLYDRRSVGTTSMRRSVLGVTFTTLGVGVLVLPHAFVSSGIVCGLIIMFFAMVMSAVSVKTIVQIIVISIHSSNRETLEEIAVHVLGRRWAMVVEANVLLCCFGQAVCYMVATREVLGHLLGRFVMVQEPEGLYDGLAHPWLRKLWDRDSLAVIACIVVALLPVFFCGDLLTPGNRGPDCVAAFRFISALSLLIVLALGANQYPWGGNHLEDAAGLLWPTDGPLGLMRMLSVAIFAFLCQPNIASVFSELQNGNFRRMEKVTWRALSLLYLLYCCIAVGGALMFGHDVKGNILDNLQRRLCNVDDPSEDPIGIALITLTVILLLTALPLSIFPIRFCAEALFFFKWPRMRGLCRCMANSIISLLCVSMVAGIAVLLPSVNIIVELVGAFSGSIVCFVSPGILFCRMVPGPLGSSVKRGAVCMVLTGVTIAIIGTYKAILDLDVVLHSKKSVSFSCSTQSNFTRFDLR